jgi:TonB family protein
VVSEVKPRYTPEAMRARVEGSVRLRGIVERDGTVSAIEVVRSLDAMYGLDQSAIDAFKQWRFQPATLDGNPVRVMIAMEMTFTLREPNVQAWPAGFDAAAPAAAPAVVDEVADADGLRMRIGRPATWSIRRASRPEEWLTLTGGDNTQVVAVERVKPAPFELAFPVTPAIAQTLTESLRRILAPQGTIAAMSLGQIQADPQAFWVWSSFRYTSNAPAESRLWVFFRTINGNALTVTCRLQLPLNLPVADADARVMRAAAEFGAIVKSIKVEKIPG